jgi:hypothetical protein
VSVLVIIASVIVVGILAFYCRRRIIGANNVILNGYLDDSAGDPLSPEPSRGVAMPICPVTGNQKNG